MLRLHDGLQPGAEIISLGAKYEIACEESQENQNGAENTNRENRRIASLAVWSFGGAQFSTFLDGNSLKRKSRWTQSTLESVSGAFHI